MSTHSQAVVCAEFVADLGERGFHAAGVGDVGRDPDGLAAGAVDVLHHAVVVVGVAGQQHDRVERGELAGYGGSGSGAYAGDDGDELGHVGVFWAVG